MAEKLINASNLKKGNYIICDGAPCIVTTIQVSRPGKHGHAKCKIEAVGIVDNQKRIFIKPGHDKIPVPLVEKKNAQILSIQDDTANVMDLESYETFDLKIPSSLKDSVKEGSQIVYWIILDNKVMKQVK